MDITCNARELGRHYAVAALLVVAAALVRYLFQPYLQEHALYLLFTVPVLGASAIGGLGPGVMATALSLGAATVLAHRAERPPVLAESLAFLITCCVIIWLGASRRTLGGRAQNSERAARERELQSRQLADELNLLIDGATGYAIYMLDTEGRVTIWNKGAERLKGWSEAEVLGRSMALFYPASEREAGKPDADLAHVRAHGRLEEEDWRLRKDGSEFLASVTLTAIRSESGELRGFGKVIRDVTDQRATERDLLAREAHLSSILSTVPDAMIVIDEAGSILSFSAAAERLFGYAEADVLGENVSILMPSPDRQAHDGYLRRYLATGEAHIIGIGRTVVGLKRNGDRFPMELSVGEARTESQRVFTGFVRDLTRQQAREERIEELRSGLLHAARVSAMGTMASTLAHELNQPITAVANYMEGIRDLLAMPDPADLPMIRDALDDAAKEALRAGHIVRRLREFVARGEVEKTVEDLPALIDDACKLALIGARERGVHLQLDMRARSAAVLVDKVQIQQVLINLMRNAMEAMAHSETRELTIATIDQPNGFVRVLVADTGHGVAPEIAPRLFTAFNTDKSGGMGLGLSICRTIVEANGGRIWMEPREGGGSIFCFTLLKVDQEAENVR